jgi:hypothetical protein
MRSRVRENLPAALGASLGILIVGWLGLTDWQWTDYDLEARPAIDALINGHLLRFAQLAPAYGGSLVLRAPFLLVPKLWHGSELTTYRAAAFPCLVASAILGVWLVSRLRAQGASRLVRGVTLMLCTANPVTLLTLEVGHPETLLGGVLALAAVLLAARNRPLAAGILLGMAVANQEWALLAIGPVLIALPAGRRWALTAAAAVAGVLLVPLIAGGGFTGQVGNAVHTGNVIFSPFQIWWFLGAPLHRVLPMYPNATRLEPHWLSLVAHPLVVAVGLPLTLLCVWLRRRGAPRPDHEALLLLVLLFLLRCALDPWDNWYYPLPFVIALLTWEVVRARPPIFTLVASVVVWALTNWTVPSRGFSTDTQAVLFLLVTVPALALIAGSLYFPGFGSRLALRRARPEPAANPA